MKKVIYLSILTLLALAGCDEFLTTGDEIIQDVNSIASGARTVLESPAGQLIPPDLRLYGLLGIGLISGIVNVWQEWRNSNMKKTAKAIVKGIENTANPDKATSEVKSNIANEMIRQGGQKFYDRANRIVDKLKFS